MMSFYFSSDIGKYTITKALFTGICRGHFLQSQIATQWHGRIIHLAIGVIEALPVVGQIVSLLEFGIIKFFTKVVPTKKVSLPLAQPISCRPRIPLIKYKSIGDDVALYWPEDLTLLGLNESQKNEIHTHLRRALLAGSILWGKKKFTYHNENFSVFVETTFPICLGMFQNNEYFLYSKMIFKRGGERRLKWAYNLMTGEFFLKKRIVGLFEKKIICLMQKGREDRGIKSILYWRNGQDKKGNVKLQRIESLRDGVTSLLFGTEPFERLSAKKELVLDFLSDLNSLHKIKITEFNISIKTSNYPHHKEVYKIPYFQAFHHDIKIKNTLVFLEKDKWRGELCDFGAAAGNPTARIISIGYTPPEYVNFYMNQRPLGMNSASIDEDEKAIIDFNIKFAHGRDIWALGLVILSILVGKEETVEWQEGSQTISTDIAPLACLKECIKSTCNSTYREEGVLQLTQEKLDKDIDKLLKEVKLKHKNEILCVEQLFKVVKHMLRINPEERKNVTDLLHIFHQK